VRHQPACECSSCCQGAPLKRPRYFPRQLITPAEMNLEQDYFRERLRLHNRMVHGWGTVCGALVCPVFDRDGEPRPWCVVVERGYLLGPCGDEIYIDCDVKVDLRKACVTGATGDPCAGRDGEAQEVRDPWCSEIYIKREEGPLYVAVRYREVLARPVPVQPVGCGCDDAACEYSRWCDGYEICVLPECLESHRNPPDLDQLFEGRIPRCPECPDSPWLILAEVEVDADGGVLSIDNCSCRRIALSFAHAWRRCSEDHEGGENAGRVRITRVEAPEQVRAGSELDVAVLGGPFPPEATLDLGPDVEVVELKVTTEVIKAHVRLAPNAEPGPRTAAVIDADGEELARAKAFEILGGGRPRPASDDQTTKKRTTRKSTTKKSSDGSASKEGEEDEA
jgi:hypothetical protein